MTYTFRRAIKSEAKPLIGLYSESGCGKTLSALYLARGFAGDRRVGMIETEAGRGEAYVDTIPGGYEVLSLRESFSPTEYGNAIDAAEKAQLAVLIIDSASHEWESIGGVLHMAAENQKAGKKGPLVWQQPKIDHQRQFMQRLISTPIPLVVVCMRAKYPMEQIKGTAEWKRSEKLEPKQSEDILFEMFVHGWIDREHKFRGTKYTLDELKQVIRDNEQISTATGARLAEWARGGAQKAQSPVQAEVGPNVRHGSAASGGGERTDAPSSDLFDERTSKIEAVEMIMNNLEEPPSEADWKAVCRAICKTEDWRTADVALIADLHTLMKGVRDRHTPSLDRANELVLKARAATRAR